jgi:methylamine--corrinoid protein Co-methyltransferase
MKNGQNYDLLLNTLDKAENGPLIDEKVWDRDVIGKTAREILTKYDIDLKKDTPLINTDDALADRLFEAGLEMAARSGVYCKDSSRWIQWTKEELRSVLNDVPREVTLGIGNDQVTVTHRRPDEASHVVIYGGPFGIPIDEARFIQFHQAYACQPLIEILNLGTLLSSHGHPIRAGSPWEAIAAKQENELAYEVLKRVGRLGMAVGCVEIATTEVGELAGTTYGGYRPTDVHKINFISEQKTAYHHLIAAAHFAHVDAFSESYFNPMYGGYFGGGSGVALACVSGSIVMRACYQGTLNDIGPTHVHISASTHPEVLRALQLGIQALARNTKLLTSPFLRPTTGPGTREIFYETGALALASAVSGCSYVDSAQSAAGTHTGCASPLEVLFNARLVHAVEGMTRSDALPIVNWMVDQYKDIQTAKMIGKPFFDLYDLSTLEPMPTWNQMYIDAVEEVHQRFGLSM